MAAVVQLDLKQQLAGAESPLTPELRDFIDRVIAPILVKEYLAVIDTEKRSCEEGPDAANSVCNTATP